MCWQIDTSDPVLDRLGAYWSGLTRGRPFPDWRDIDPIDIPRSCLRYVVVADVLDGGDVVRYRLVGTHMVERFGYDFAGKTTAEIMSDSYHAFITGLFKAMVHAGAPIYSRSGFRWDAGRYLTTARLFMPLSNGGTDIAMAFIGQTFADGTEVPPQPLVRVMDAADFETVELRALTRTTG